MGKLLNIIFTLAFALAIILFISMFIINLKQPLIQF